MVFQIGNNSQNQLNIKTLAVDTNILLWMFYGNSMYAQAYQKNIYPDFLVKMISNKACKIYTTIFNICELCNVIEKTEYELYLQENNLKQEDFNKKRYRQIVEEREKIKKIIKLSYDQISQVIEIESYNVDEEFILEYIEKYVEHKYDIFDFALIKFCEENEIKYLLTDDSDFISTIEEMNINIITANKKRNTSDNE